VYFDKAYAKVDYFSLHEITSELNEPLTVKMNIIEVDSSTPLQFVIQVEGDVSGEGIVLEYHRINQFMLTLTHNEPLIGGAIIHAYEHKRNRWRRTKSVTLSNLSHATPNTVALTQAAPIKVDIINKTSHLNNKLTEINSHKMIESQEAPSLKPTIKKQIKPKTIINSCFIEHDEKETLWSLASRHKLTWKTSVYGAMIAIYSANANKFSDKHILRLIKGSQLKCPSNGLLQALSNKEIMKTQFQELASY
jgi:FimV-like protein